MKKFLTSFWEDESGLTSVEYALLLAFVAAGIIVSVGTLSDAVEGELTSAGTCVSTGNC